MTLEIDTGKLKQMKKAFSTVVREEDQEKYMYASIHIFIARIHMYIYICNIVH